MAMQLFILLGVGAWLGQKADKALYTEPLFTIFLMMLFLTGFFYKLVKDLNRKDER
jgi:F0F1-type ATP synthase assembly protein I